MTTHGTLMQSGSNWLIQASPYVTSRLKRWLPQCDPRTVGQLRVKRSPEVDADLEAFLERFPLEADPGDLVSLHAGAELLRQRERSVGEILAATHTPREFSLAVPPREYQRVMAELWLSRRRALCADGMGLGKTITAICGLSELLKSGPALVVAPKQVVKQWAYDVLPKVLPGVRTHILEGIRPYDIAHKAAQQDLFAKRNPRRGLPDVLVTTYERLDAWAPILAPVAAPAIVRAMVLDECVALRHRDTDKWRAARHISERVDYVLGLDGYPIGNYGGEIGAVLDIIEPGCLGTPEEFDREWCVATEDARKKRVKDPIALGLHLRQRGLMVRRTAREVGRELPKMEHIVVTIDHDPKELERIKGPAAELARVILSQNASGLAKGKATRDLDRIARQATGIAKAHAAAAFIRGVVESGERVLVGAWHREVWNILAEELREFGPGFITGAESDAKKEEALRRFKDKSTPILGISLRSGSGIDGLQKANCRILIEVELDWAPHVHDQLRQRLDRDGQPDPVVTYTLVIADGSDPTVADVVCAKRANSSPIINGEGSILAATGDPDAMRKLAARFDRPT